jgi:hypothetical protein
VAAPQPPPAPPAPARQEPVGECGSYEETGVNVTRPIHVDLSAGEIGFIDGVQADNERSTAPGSLFITITGPFRKTVSVFTGAYCGDIDTSRDYSLIKAQRDTPPQSLVYTYCSRRWHGYGRAMTLLGRSLLEIRVLMRVVSCHLLVKHVYRRP